MGAVAVPLKLTARHVDGLFGNVFVSAAPSVEAPGEGDNWKTPTPRRGLDSTEWSHTHQPSGTSTEKCDTVQELVNTDVATYPSTRLPTCPGMAHQRSNGGLIQSTPNLCTRLIFIVDGASAVSSFVMRSAVPWDMAVPLTTRHCRTSPSPENLGWSNTSRSRRAMVFPSRNMWVLVGSTCAVDLFSASENQGEVVQFLNDIPNKFPRGLVLRHFRERRVQKTILRSRPGDPFNDTESEQP